MDVITLHYPAYRLLGLMKLGTALVSWVTVFAIIPITPRALAMRFPEELEREVDERKRAEEALRKLNAELEERVRERTHLATRRAEELARAKEEAERANSVKSEFLAVMSHELRTPLNGVRGMLEFLHETKMSQEQREYAETALSCSNTLLHLIDDLLDLSKIEAGKLEIRRKPFSLKTMLADIDNVYGPTLEHTDLTLRTQLDESLPDWVVGDEARIVQVVTNLVGNAIKYSKQGVVTLSVQKVEDLVRLVVKDQGPGIPEEFQESLFEPFTQLDSSTARSYGGVGLGLAVVQRLTSLMGGTLGFESADGQGTQFEITLSLPACQPPVETDTPGGECDLSPFLVLVVEDNPINRRVVTTQLEKLHTGEVVVAEDGRKALDILSERTVDLILLDCQMPGLDGFEVARLIRSDADRYGKPVIIALTAHALSEERQRCLDVGMDDFLSKPLAFKNLRATLKLWSEKLTVKSVDRSVED